MIPISLSIEGLYSYQTLQTIDFTDLTDAGLFGIFGAVGSGKSSILEAITFALYGKTERLNESGDARNYNMMNLRSNRSSIDFTFLNYQNNKYRITRSFRRNSKKFDDVKPADTILYRWEDEKWIPQASSKTEDIIGLSYQNFKRTIIIPQGQFKEFLELGPTDRTRMLKEIFDLQRFDLQAKTAALYAKTKSHIDHLEGQLTAYENIKESIIEDNKKLSLLEAKQLKEQEEKLLTKDNNLKLLQNLKDDFELLVQKKTLFEQLIVDKPHKDALALQLSIFEKTQLSFAALIQKLDEVQIEREIKNNNLNEETQILNQLQSSNEKIKKNIALIQNDYDLLPQKRVEEMDLNLIQQMALLKTEVDEIEEREKKGQSFILNVKENIQNFKAQQLLFQEQLILLKSSKPNAGVLLAIENWFVLKSNLDNQSIDINTKLSKTQSEIDLLNTALSKDDYDKNKYVKVFEQKQQVIDEQIEKLRHELSNIEVQQKLSSYAHNLKDGEACPLCGAEEHPQVLKVEDLSSHIASIHSKINDCNLASKNLQSDKEKVNQICYSLNSFEKQKEDLIKENDTVKHNLEEHLKAFLWEGFDAGDKAKFEDQKQYLNNIEKEISSLESSLSSQTQALEKEQNNLEKAQEKIESLTISLVQKKAQFNQNNQHLQHLKWTSYAHESSAKIASVLQDLKANNQKTENDYLHFTQELNLITPKLAGQASKIAEINLRLNELFAEEQNNVEQIDKRLKENNLNHIEEAKAILSQALNVEAIKNEIETFRVEYKSLEIGIGELQEKLKDKAFDTTQLANLENDVLALKNLVKTQTEKVAQINANIERESAELIKKKELLLALDTNNTRFDNLNIMKKLFDRAGFVDYVSSIYLQQLCDMANLRFHQLTRNQLSLQLNVNNDFEIIDYLNEGKTRSVKTLSGGQSFQVSLCLALALAESVQSNAKADKNFFFIDEGFGTQDAASVNIVFETLMNLRKENRIVGIISHVDELKEKIPVSLSIIKDEAQGSLILKSWN